MKDKQEVLRLSNEESNKLTRECMKTALISLMNEKPFDKITITELVKKSGVSRTAFYRNYNTKEDIILDICNEIFTAISNSIFSDKYKNNSYQLFYDYFYKIKENENDFRLLVKAGISQATPIKLENVLEKIIPCTTIKSHYKLITFETAFFSIVVDWFNNGMKEDISFMANFCNDFLKSLQTL